MDFDDTPEKLRRNLMVLTTIIIGFNFLDLRFPEQILGSPLGQHQHFRVWCVVGLMLAYFFFRFFHTAEAKEGRKGLAGDSKTARDEIVRRCVELALYFYGRWGTALPFSPLFFDGRVRSLVHEFGESVRVVRYSVRDFGYDPSKGKAGNNIFSVDITYLAGGSGRASVPSAIGEVNYRKWFILFASSLGGIRAALMTKNFVEVVVPYIATVVAMFALAGNALDAAGYKVPTIKFHIYTIKLTR